MTLEQLNLDKSNWRKVKLGDICQKILSGNRLPKGSLKDGSIPYVVAKTTNKGIEQYIDKNTLDYNGKSMKLFDGNCISFSIDNPDAIFYRDEPFFTSNIMRVVRIDKFEKEHYLFIMTQLKEAAKNYDWGRKFSGPVVNNTEVSIPTNADGNIDYETIYNIGKIIDTYDKLIESEQSKYNNLLKQKGEISNGLFTRGVYEGTRVIYVDILQIGRYLQSKNWKITCKS